MSLKDRLLKLEADHKTSGESLAERLRRARAEFERGERKHLSDSELRAIAKRIRGRPPV